MSCVPWQRARETFVVGHLFVYESLAAPAIDVEFVPPLHFGENAGKVVQASPLLVTIGEGTQAKAASMANLRHHQRIGILGELAICSSGCP